MIQGSTTSAIPAFDLQFENYSWMDYLATAGFDVFAMDLTGYGLSPRPMCLTAEYTARDKVDELIRADLEYAKSLWG